MSQCYLKKRLRRLHKRNPRCHWCECITVLGENNSPNTATIDHLNSRNDFDKRLAPNHNREIRTVLSCYKCNNERGIEEHLKLPMYIRRLRSFGGGLLEEFKHSNISLREKFKLIRLDALKHRARCLPIIDEILIECSTDEEIISFIKNRIDQNNIEIITADKNRKTVLNVHNTFLLQFLPKITDKDTIQELMKDINKVDGKPLGFTIGHAVRELTKKFVHVDGNVVAQIVKERFHAIPNLANNRRRVQENP